MGSEEKWKGEEERKRMVEEREGRRGIVRVDKPVGKKVDEGQGGKREGG